MKCLDKRVEEVLLRNVGDLHPHYLLNSLAVRGLERTKTPNIKRLEKVGRMGRHIELGRAPVQVELGPLGLFRGRECLFFRFRVAFSLYIRAPEAAQPFGQEADNQTL